MKAVSGKRLCKVLEKHGWTLQRIRSSHHVYARAGEPQIISIPVHANKDLKVGLLSALLKQAGLTEKDL